MIARMWHGRVPICKSDEYLHLMQTVAIPDYESIPGNCGAYVLQQSTDDVTHFVMLTFWDNKEAVAAFAGAEIEKAKYYDFDHKFLLELEPHVQHYEIFGK